MSYSLPPHIPYTTNMKSNSYCHRINEGLSDVIRRPSISDLSSSGQLMSVPDMIDDAWHQSPMVILPTGRSTLDSLAAFLRAYGSIKKTKAWVRGVGCRFVYVDPGDIRLCRN